MKKLFLLFGILFIGISIYGQSNPKRDVTITKTNPTLKLDGSNGQINFNDDASIVNSTSNNIVIDGGIVTIDDGLTVDGTSGLIIRKLILKGDQLIAISSTGDILQYYAPVANRINGDDYYPTITYGTSAPSTTPTKIGDRYINTSTKKEYCAMGISSSDDWVILN